MKHKKETPLTLETVEGLFAAFVKEHVPLSHLDEVELKDFRALVRRYHQENPESFQRAILAANAKSLLDCSEVYDRLEPNLLDWARGNGYPCLMDKPLSPYAGAGSKLR